ncbi:hypothetical protein LJE86_07325 [bacterium BMS3Abin03]|jgi:hypothetical protein|nr:hypothetical protein [bacterium BMS3Abin03]MCG6958347.1 hypothetical protein [bacterium BMS3Abin03]
MKKFWLILLILATAVFAQQRKTLSTLDLEQEFKNPINSPGISVNQNSFEIPAEKKSPGLAILYSFLLPGMGELYANNYNSGKYFTIAEGIFWGTYIGMNVYANARENDYKAFAETYGSANISEKDADYFATIGQYDNIEIYNDEKALERNFDEMYDTEIYYWKWQNTEDRKTYRNIRTSSEQTFNDLRFVVGAMILNRIASAINAVRLVASYNSSLSEEMGWNLSVEMRNSINLPTSLNLNFQTSF